MGEKTKLPKSIGGIKLPKKVRKRANKALSALDQPMVRNLASVALAAASAAAAKHADGARDAAEDGADRPDQARAKPAEPGSEIKEIAAGLAMAAIAKWLGSGKSEPTPAPHERPSPEAGSDRPESPEGTGSAPK